MVCFCSFEVIFSNSQISIKLSGQLIHLVKLETLEKKHLERNFSIWTMLSGYPCKDWNQIYFMKIRIFISLFIKAPSWNRALIISVLIHLTNNYTYLKVNLNENN